MSHVNVSIGNLTVSNQANAGPDLSLDQSAVSADQSIGVNQQPVQEEEEEMFDDSLDELISHIPDPVTPPAEPTPGTSGLNRSNAFGATQQSSQESFDPYVYRDLLDDRVFARSRKIAGLDDTLPIIGRRFGGGGDDESDDESEGFLFDD